MRIVSLVGTSLAGLALLLGTRRSGAQDGARIPELRPFVGLAAPVGGQRHAFHAAPIGGVQLALQRTPHLHVVGTAAWTAGETKYGASNDEVNVYQLDVGVEWNARQRLAEGWWTSPFVGAGAGARRYDYHARELATSTCAEGYGAVGGEYGLERAALHAEARGQVFGFHAPLAGAPSRTRAELTFSLAFVYHMR